MLARTLVPCALVALFAAPAAAQAPTSPPTPYGYAPAATATPDHATPPPETTSAFPLYDRRGRRLVGTRHEMQSDRGLWGLGLGLFLAGWALDIVGTAVFNGVSHDRDGAVEEDAMAWSILPLVGPFIQLGLQAPHPALPITSGLLQISGLVAFIVGISSQHDVEIPVYGWGDPRDPRTARIGVDLVPTEGGAYAAVTLHTM